MAFTAHHGRGMDRLDKLEQESVFVLREAYHAFDKMAMLWSLGKDSNVMLWLARKAFFGHIPFPLVHVDTGKKFKEMYEFRERYSKEWGVDLIVRPCPDVAQEDRDLPPAARSAARKTAGLKAVLAEFGFDGLVAGIRRDEQGTRAKERFFSPRKKDGSWDIRQQPPEFWNHYNTTFSPDVHVRIHPLLSWNEIDIWRYVAREAIPVVSLYFAKDGMRYRSLGDEDITKPVKSEAMTLEAIIDELEQTRLPERAGRMMDHEREDAFERLRTTGYL